MANITPGLGVGFRVGTQDTVNLMMGQGVRQAEPGHFYLTEDTHRLYVGNDDKTLSPVNQGITFVDKIDLLPTFPEGNTAWKGLQGQFYYVINSNILCVCSGETWVQINPDTYLVGNFTDDGGVSVSNSSLNTGIMAVQKDGTNKVRIKTRVQDTIGPGKVQHTAGGWVTIVGGNNVTVDADVTTQSLTLSTPDGALYTLEVAKTSDNDYDDRVDIILKQDSNGVVTEKARIPIVSGDGGVRPTLTNDNKIKIDGGGIAGATFTISQDETTHKLIVTIQDASARKTFGLIPCVIIGDNEQKFFTYDSATGVLSLDLDVYTKAQIDSMFKSKLNSLDAMYFAGTIGQNGTLNNLAALKAKTDLRSGATFKIVSEIDTIPNGMVIDGLGGKTVLAVGDLIIVTGTENADGILVSDIKYTYVPSGDDIDKYFTPNFGTANELSFQDSSDIGNVHKVQFEGGEHISVTGTPGTRSQKISIVHTGSAPTTGTDNPLTQNANDSNPSFTIISEVTADSTGHVTGIKTKKITLWSNSLKTVTTTAKADTSGAVTVAHAYEDEQGIRLFGNGAAAANSKVNDWAISSDTLDIKVAEGGSLQKRAEISVDMVWQKFEYKTT